MNLRRLEIQGFKTFAQKTVLEFISDKNGNPGITSIVGPNGSGKSNIADAIRWVIGEQSMRSLRAKKSEDLIFGGTPKKSRSGFAEVVMVIENNEAKEDELREIVITRRVYRDGKSEYEINKKSVRLSDVTLLLAQSGLGQRTYSVIGQGMVDRILSASPAERKEFFDEAAGLRPFQIKRNLAKNKLDSSKEKLLHGELVLRELAPRLSSLERQAKRLEERDDLKKKVEELEARYYGFRWGVIRGEIAGLEGKKKSTDQTASTSVSDISDLKAELEKLEKTQSKGEMHTEEREALQRFQLTRSEIREQIIRLEARTEAMKHQKGAGWSPLPLSKIVKQLAEIGESINGLLSFLEESKDIKSIREHAERVLELQKSLATALERPAPEKQDDVDPEVEKELKALKESLSRIEEEMQKKELSLKEKQGQEGKERSRVFELQREMSKRLDQQFKAEQAANVIAVDFARVEARKESLIQDIRANSPAKEGELDKMADNVEGSVSGQELEEMSRKLSKARSRLEWIGGIDSAVLSEYKETKIRFDDMSEQANDLKEAINSLETIIGELDETIQKQAALSFQLLNKEFGVYFKKLFDGGEAKLIEIQPEPKLDEDGNVIEEVVQAGPAGFEIMATPPGKRVKSIALLSGGERALTSIALLCAIMATNPSPFVVLDEVDAALDEANSEKFAVILEELAERTQFVVITHNRATMNHAHVLYGVTMGDDGVSKLLSVKLEDILAKS